MEIKHSEKWKVLTITDKKENTSTAMTTKQNKTTGNLYLQKQSMTTY